MKIYIAIIIMIYKYCLYGRCTVVKSNQDLMTKRFDRNNGKMIHTKTLAGNSPDVYSYEQLITVCGNLSSDKLKDMVEKYFIH